MSTALAERSWSLVVPHHAPSARAARQRLGDELGGVVDSALLADVVTVTAELVGNSVLHARPLPGGVIRVEWRHRTSCGVDLVEVRVTDGGGAGQPAPRRVALDDTTGRGLHIVSALAHGWGVVRDGLGQTVWAELRAPTA